MNKIKLFSTLALSTFVLAAGATIASANNVATEGSPASATTGSVIEFLEDQETIVMPQDPEDPSNPHPVEPPVDEDGNPILEPGDEVEDPDGPSIITPGPAGALWLAERPALFDFGVHAINSTMIFGGGVYRFGQELSWTDEDRVQAVSVHDGRINAQGWHVVADLTSFTDEAGADSLVGATIHINNLTNGSLTNQFGHATSFGNVTGGTFSLTSGGSSTTLFQADPNARGTSAVVIGGIAEEGDTPNVEIEIAGSSLATGEHTATLTWTLSAGPAS